MREEKSESASPARRRGEDRRWRGWPPAARERAPRPLGKSTTFCGQSGNSFFSWLAASLCAPALAGGAAVSAAPPARAERREKAGEVNRRPVAISEGSASAGSVKASPYGVGWRRALTDPACSRCICVRATGEEGRRRGLRAKRWKKAPHGEGPYATICHDTARRCRPGRGSAPVPHGQRSGPVLPCRARSARRPGPLGFRRLPWTRNARAERSRSVP